MEALFRAVRKACTREAWSRGVQLSRAGAVAEDRPEDEGVVLRVTTHGGMTRTRVTLFLEDADWDCECGALTAACEHVAAAVIALRQARESGEEIAAPAVSAGGLVYRFRRKAGGLWIDRGIERGGVFRPLEAPLDLLVSGRGTGPLCRVTVSDRLVDTVLGGAFGRLVPRPLVARLLTALARCEHVLLDDRRVRTSPEPVRPVVRVTEHAGGFRLALTEDPDLAERFDNGAALEGSTLRPLSQPKLTAREVQELVRGRFFEGEAVAELVAEVLPDLRKRIRIEVMTPKLPEAAPVKPRIRLDVHREGSRLSVLATLVYGDPPVARVDGGRLTPLEGPPPIRDDAAEHRLVRRLGRELSLAPGIREEFEGEAGVFFAERLERWETHARDDALSWFRRAPPLVTRPSLEEGAFDLRFETERPVTAGGARARAETAAVLRAWREGRSLVPLSEGGWAPLPADWLERFGHRVCDLLAARDEAGRVPACSLPDLARLCEDLGQPPPPGFDRLRVLVEDFRGIREADLPDDLTATLRRYQRRGVDWLCFLRDARLGGLLADDMGLGKTLQALCAIRGRTLVVAPTSVVHNWAREAARFRPGLRVGVYHGPHRALDPAVDLTLTSYALLRLDRDALAEVAWDTIVLDEAQAIKNPESQVARAAYALEGEFKLSLTGTPVENRLDELWSQFHFVNRGLLGGQTDFQERYARPIDEGDTAAADRLRERVRPFLLRRLKGEVAPELPPRTDVVLHCELVEQERAVYEAVRASTREEVLRRLGAGGNVMVALEALLRLRQAACHPGLVPGQHAPTSTKTRLLLDSLETVAAEGHRALVFSQWTAMLDLVEPHLEALGIEHLRLDGSTRDRQGVVDRFQDETGPPVLLISLKAGGTGLNLTRADHVFLVDPWWNPAVENQAADRAHRIGQERPVMVYRLVAADTVEERILALQESKRDLASVPTGAGAAGALTREDLLALLQ